MGHLAGEDHAHVAGYLRLGGARLRRGWHCSARWQDLWATFQQQYADAQAAWWAAVEPQYLSTVTRKTPSATTYQATADSRAC